MQCSKSVRFFTTIQILGSVNWLSGSRILIIIQQLSTKTLHLLTLTKFWFSPIKSTADQREKVHVDVRNKSFTKLIIHRNPVYKVSLYTYFPCGIFTNLIEDCVTGILLAAYWPEQKKNPDPEKLKIKRSGRIRNTAYALSTTLHEYLGFFSQAQSQYLLPMCPPCL